MDDVKPIREWDTEALATLLHRSEYGAAVADHLQRHGPLDNKMGDYAVYYAKVIHPLALEVLRLRELREENDALHGLLHDVANVVGTVSSSRGDEVLVRQSASDEPDRHVVVKAPAAREVFVRVIAAVVGRKSR